jgi:hypothetical protein
MGAKLRRLSAFLLFLGVATYCSSETGGVRYRLQTRIEPEAHKLEADVVILHSPSNQFYLYKGFSINKVTVDGKLASFHADPAAAALPYSPGAVAYAVDAAQGRTLQVAYSGAIDETVSSVNTISSELVELALYASWYPVFRGLDRFAFELQANLPKNYLAISNGKEKSVLMRGGRTIGSWESSSQAFDIVLLASPSLHRVKQGAGASFVEIDSAALPTSFLQSQAGYLLAARRQLEATLGAPRDASGLQVAYSPRKGWGYSRIPLIVVSEEFATRAVSDPIAKQSDLRYIFHELSHFWWSIANTGSADDWINEGLAEYSSYLIAQKQFGKSFADRKLAEYKDHASHNQTADSIAETESSSADREVNRYDKCALMFIAAEEKFGEKNLDRSLRAFYVRFAESRGATTALFLDEVEKTMGGNAADFFREELYRKPAIAKK